MEILKNTCEANAKFEGVDDRVLFYKATGCRGCCMVKYIRRCQLSAFRIKSELANWFRS
jgi:hypothetical protein